jgi:hypothetical protein
VILTFVHLKKIVTPLEVGASETRPPHIANASDKQMRQHGIKYNSKPILYEI